MKLSEQVANMEQHLEKMRAQLDAQISEVVGLEAKLRKSLQVVPHGAPVEVQNLMTGAYLTCDFDGIWHAMAFSRRDTVWGMIIRNVVTGEETMLNSNAMVQPVSFLYGAVE